jgi:hypothetical protein
MEQQSKQRRRRGVILTHTGFQKLQAAKLQAEALENGEKRYTLEDLSDRTRISIDTLTKVFACESPVDKQTLKQCFQSFGLILVSEDYDFPEVPDPTTATSGSDLAKENFLSDRPSPFSSAPIAPASSAPELPEGQVPLNSRFYIERPPIEASCYQAIANPGALIRIKGARQMGKTSLIVRILHQASQCGYHPVSLSFQLADASIFQSLDNFLQWFCANVGLELRLPNQLGNYWNDLFGSKVCCKMYFEQYLLEQVQQPIVLGLDDVDRLFQYPQLASDFFGLLRTWHEEAKSREIWKKLRLVVAHSMEVLLPLSINQSPFNVGLPIELQPLTPEQIEQLAERHELTWSPPDTDRLMQLIGGQTYLVRRALYQLQDQHLTLDQWLPTAATPTGAYREHLQKKLWQLQQEPELLDAFSGVISATEAVELTLTHAFKLQSMGLVHLQGNQAVPSCPLYVQYFRTFGKVA